IASGLQPIPTRCNEAPNDLPPKLRLVSAGLSRFPAPTHKSFQYIANNLSSRRIPVQAPRSEFQRESVAALGSLQPLEPAPWSLLPVSLWSSSRRLVLPRNRQKQGSTGLLDKSFFSFYLRYGFVFCLHIGFVEIK